MTSEQHQFTAQGRTFPVILVRKKVKNINLHVRSDGTLYLSAPARVPWAYIEDFLEKKTDFIIREMEERKQKFPILTLSDGDTLYLAGQPYRLDVRLGLHNSLALKHALGAMDHKFEGTQHTALADAINTSAILTLMQDDAKFKETMKPVLEILQPKDDLSSSIGDLCPELAKLQKDL